MRVFIEKFEDKFAVVVFSDGQRFNICRSRIPHTAKIGDYLLIKNNEIMIDEIPSKGEDECVIDLYG